MAQTKSEIQALLAEAGSEPRHRFGQNFMIDQNLVRIIADAGGIGAGDLIIEVGPGTGTLSEEILARGGELIAVEIDRDLAEMLRGRFADNPKFRLIEGDALAGKHGINAELVAAIDGAKAAGRGVKLVANLPYNIASPLVIELLIAGVGVLAYTVQREVADRMRAGAGDDAYGPLSVMAGMLSRVEVLRVLPPQAFWPMPKIDSALVKMTREDRTAGEARAFGVFVHKVFSYRRKTLRKALGQAGYEADAVLAGTGLDGGKRPEEFTPAEFWAMYKSLGRQP